MYYYLYIFFRAPCRLFVPLRLKPCQMPFTSLLAPCLQKISFTMVLPWIATHISPHRLGDMLMLLWVPNVFNICLFVICFIVWVGLKFLNDVLERRTSTGSWLFALLGRDFEQIIGQIVSIRVKTLSNTNLVAWRHIKREKSSLPVDVRRSKTPLLKLPNRPFARWRLFTVRDLKQGRRRQQWKRIKKWICVLSNLIASIWTRSICQMQATFPGVEFLRILFRFKKRKEKHKTSN